MSWKSWVVQSVTKATAEQELPHQQFRFGVLAFYRCHATMSLLFRQFVHDIILYIPHFCKASRRIEILVLLWREYVRKDDMSVLIL